MYILSDLPLSKKSKKVFSLLIQALLSVKKPIIRELARILLSPNYSSPQALVNRIRRFLHNHKWNFIDVQLNLAGFIIKRLKSSHPFVFFLSDFTYITNKWRILSFAVPIGGRALPILLIPVRFDSFSKLRWKSEVDLIIHAISLLLPILPKGTVFVFDREFTYPELMKFLMKNGMYFIIRLKRNVYVNGKPLWKLGSGVYENVLVHKVIANVFVRGYISEGGKEDFYAYVSNLPANMLSWELYRKRMKIEEMFRDEKNKLNLELLSYIEEEEVLGRWLTVYMGALLTVYLLTKMEEKKRKAKWLLKELEKGMISLINFGLLLLTNFYRLRIKISKKRRLVIMFEEV